MLNNTIKLPIFISLLTFVFLMATIYGTIISFSPVPFWDMWDGYIGFYLHTLNHDYSIWWSQHNEHRILFSRILFWLDLKYFSGTTLFLIVMNFILMASIWLTMFNNAKMLLGHLWTKSFSYITASLLFMVSFSWMQRGNIAWGFQSQFFCAFLFPMVSFQLFAIYACLKNSPSREYLAYLTIISSVFFGVLATCNLACGILCMPLLVIMAINLQQPKKISYILLLISCITTTAYLYDYKTPIHHGNVIETALHDSSGMFQYIIAYLGSPFFLYKIRIYCLRDSGCIFSYWFSS